ncbi:peroxiredoxin family protein [Thiorhodococcus minor]|nr:TlpA disulfide reductase family protein [Thiorhodococcus minor]
MAAEFELSAPDGSVHRLADYRGAPLILNFWATWCPPCRAEMPSLQRAHEQLAQDGIGVLAINVGEDPETVDRFRQDFKLDLPLPIDTDTSVTQAYPMRGLPTTFVIDAQGRLALRASGELAWDHPEVLERVRRLK